MCLCNTLHTTFGKCFYVETLQDSRADKADSRIDSIFQMRLDVTKKPKFMFERSADVMDAQTNTDSTIADDLLDESVSSFEAVIMKDIINGSILPNNSLVNYADAGIPQNVSNRAIFNERMLTLVRHYKHQSFPLSQCNL